MSDTCLTLGSMEDVTRLPERAATAVTTPASDWGRSGQLSPGTLLAGRFRIVAPLGRGGMGEVYRADDLKLGQTVALKFLPDHLTHDPSRLAQFHNEVRVARTVSHRNVCRMYDIGDANGRPFLAMEYVDGEDLASLLRRIGRFPQDKAVEVARQMCAGLAAAHERGVLHRDFKPANVMIDGEGHVRITDFGLAALAGREPMFDSAEGWSINRDYLSYAAGRRDAVNSWPELSTGRTGTLTFWYRTSPSPLFSSTNNLLPSSSDPPFTSPDMRLMRLDPAGRLVEFHSIPPQREDATQPAAAPDWSTLFEAAGLTMSAFHEVEPRWLPRSESDVRAAWEGPFPDVDGLTARVEAAAYRARPIFFSVIAPWTQPAQALLAQARARSFRDVIPAAAALIGVLVLASAALLARRNLRSGRGDRRGAFRTAAIVFLAQTAGYLLHARHYASIDLKLLRVWDILAYTSFSAGTVWLLYMALEPYVRRFWPQLLIGWNRLLSGRVRDPLVGRDVLIGVAAGTIGALLITLLQVAPQLLGRPVTPFLPSGTILLGTRYAVDAALLTMLRSLVNALQVVAIVVFLKILVKRNWLVLVLSTLFILPVAMTGLVQGQAPAIEGAIFVAGVLLVIGVLLRFGLLAVIVTFYTFIAMEIFPLTMDLSRPYAATSAVVVIAIAAIAAYGFYASRGGEPLFGRALLD